MTVLSPPIPPLQNLPIEPQFYQPSLFFISNITLGQFTTVTTTANHNYVIGQQCRLIIPPGFGCRLLNEQIGYVLSIPAPNQIVLNIVSTGADPFQTNTFTTQPQILGIGDVNTGQVNTNGLTNQNTFIPGSFINISP